MYKGLAGLIRIGNLKYWGKLNKWPREERIFTIKKLELLQTRFQIRKDAE